MPDLARSRPRPAIGRAALACALLFTSVMAWAAADFKASYLFSPRLHGIVHLGVFALFAAVWARALPRLGVMWIIGAMFAFGFAHEGWQIVGHRHPFELGDALVDGIGAAFGALLMRSPLARITVFGPRRSQAAS